MNDGTRSCRLGPETDVSPGYHALLGTSYADDGGGVGRLGATLPTRVHGRVKYTSLAEPGLGIVYRLGPTALHKWISPRRRGPGQRGGNPCDGLLPWRSVPTYTCGSAFQVLLAVSEESSIGSFPASGALAARLDVNRTASGV